MTETFEGYLDVEATERSRFERLDGVGPATAQTLVERYDTVGYAARSLLSYPGHPSELSPKQAASVKDALEAAGYSPRCECDSHSDVKYHQPNDADVFDRCRACDTVLTEQRNRDGVRVGQIEPAGTVGLHAEFSANTPSQTRLRAYSTAGGETDD